MPSIPTYGFAELEPSILNTAKRRIVGLMDTTQEALTEEPKEDPTGGKQDTFLEQLTEEIYTTIKDIEVLDSYINENSGVDELRLTTAGKPNTLRTLRPELRKGASKIAEVNNALRKINATYERLRTNIQYTNLKIFTYFVNAVRILKKTALDFFGIIDDLIDNIRKAQGATSYIRPVINNNDEELETEDPPSSAIVPPFLSTPTPVFPPLSLAPPPPPPPPPPKPSSALEKFKNKVEQLGIDAGLDPTEIATLQTTMLSVLTTTKKFPTTKEIEDEISAMLGALPPAPPAPAPPAPAPPAPAPSTAPVIETFSEMVDRITANLAPQEQIDVAKGITQFINQFQKEPTELEVQDIITQVINPKGSSSSSSSSGIAQGVPLPAQGTPAQGVAVGTATNFQALFNASAQLKPKITKIGKDKLTRNEVFLQEAIDKNDQTDITKYSNKLQTIIDIGNKPFVRISNADVRNLSIEDMKELSKLENAYRAAKQNLSEKTTQLDNLIKFLDDNGIGYTNPP